MNNLFTTIRRTPYQSFASFFSLSLTLFLAMGIFIIVSVVYGLLGYVESLPQITAYFQSQTTENDILKLKEELLATGKVQSIKYVSKNDAYQIYKQLNKDNPLLLEMVTSDILPASLEIFAIKPSYLPELNSLLNKKPGIDEVVFQKNIVDRLLSITSFIKIAAFVFLFFLVFSNMIILMTITHFKIALKKDEIELMRLLGATPWYILKPFIVEGLFFAVLSAAMVFSFFFIVVFASQHVISSYLQGIIKLSFNTPLFSFTIWPLNFVFAFTTYILSLAFAACISFFSTILASKKYIQ